MDEAYESKGNLLDEHRMLADERRLVFGSEAPPIKAWALCFSGGGIRSGTFCLGIMQGLAKGYAQSGGVAQTDQPSSRGILTDFHYLSTVSGGGYAGSWLTRLRTERANWKELLVASGGSRGVPGSAGQDIHPVRRLRSFSNYMSPKWGISLDGLTVIVEFVTTLLASLAIWAAAILFFATLPSVLVDVLEWLSKQTGTIIEVSARSSVLYAIPIVAAVAWLAVALAQLGLARFQWTTATNEKVSRSLAVIAAIGFGWLVYVTIFVLIPEAVSDWFYALSNGPEPEATERLKNLVWTLAKQGANAEAGGVGLGGTILAVLISLWGYWSRNGNQIKQEALGLSGRFGSAAFNLLAAAALILFCVSAALATKTLINQKYSAQLIDTGYWAQLTHYSAVTANWLTAPAWRLLLFSFAIALVVSFLKGANRSSLHGLYASRLTRAYLGSARMKRNPSIFTGFDSDDDCALNVPFKDPEGKSRLVHIINMTLNMGRNGARSADWQERMGASFTASPFHCGSSSTNYVGSEKYEGVLTLGRAMAISGAAVSPNMGYHSAPGVRTIMTIFNVRLGWWLSNPNIAGQPLVARDRWKFWKPHRQSDEPRMALFQILKEALGFTEEKSDWLYLSDGGHFDNLGLYEMIRRRCSRIVVIDAGCDGRFEHTDLHIAMTKAFVDFGARIELPPTLPGQEGPGEKQRVVVGKVLYEKNNNEPECEGQIFIVKPILTGAEPSTLLQYALTSRKANHTFPHHSTLDQFFDETQFERYRQLGEFSARELMETMELVDHPGYEPTNPSYPLLPKDPNSADKPKVTTAPIVPANDNKLSGNPPPATITGWQSLSTAVQSMSTVKLLIGTAATVSLVGAGLRVSGEVAMRAGQEIGIVAPDLKGEVEFSDPKGILKDGIEVKLDDSQILGQELADLKEQVDRLSRIKFENSDPQPNLDEIRKQYAEISDRLRQLLTRPIPEGGKPGSPGPPGPSGFTEDQRDQILSDIRRIDTATQGKMGRPAPMLKTIVDRLQRIENMLLRIRPDIGVAQR